MDTQTEDWRPVVGYEGLYSVSSHGRVRSEQRKVRYVTGKTQTVRERIMSPARKRSGHLSVMFYPVGKRFHVHRLVMLAFTDGPPTPLHEVAHNDGDAGNNMFSNLRWATTSSNMQDKVQHGTHNRGERHANCTIQSATVHAIRLAHGTYKSIGQRFGVAMQTAWEIKTGRRRIYD